MEYFTRTCSPGRNVMHPEAKASLTSHRQDVNNSYQINLNSVTQASGKALSSSLIHCRDVPIRMVLLKIETERWGGGYL